jgi:hypothetical protein
MALNLNIISTGKWYFLLAGATRLGRKGVLYVGDYETGQLNMTFTSGPSASLVGSLSPFQVGDAADFDICHVFVGNFVDGEVEKVYQNYAWGLFHATRSIFASR